MEEEGCERTGSQCREKVKKLRGDYRKIKDNNNESGRVRRSSKIFEAKDRILGHKPAMHPSVVVDRLSQTIVEGSEYTHAEAIDVSNSYDSTDADIHLDESSCAGSSTL